MSIQSFEQHLAKYHLLHFVIGAILAAILLSIPKLIGVGVAVFLIAMVVPTAVLPVDFTGSKWIDRASVVVGAIAVGVVFHFLHKI